MPSVHLQTLPGPNVPPPDGAVSTAGEGGFILQLAEGHIALMTYKERKYELARLQLLFSYVRKQINERESRRA